MIPGSIVAPAVSSSSPQFVSSSYTNNTSTDNVNVPVPDNVQDGDFLVAFGFTNDSLTDLNLPSGWSLQSDIEYAFIATKVASGESGNYVFDWQNTQFNVCVAVMAFRGVSNITLGSWKSLSSGATSDAPDVSVSGGLRVTCSGMDGSRTVFLFGVVGGSSIGTSHQKVNTTNAASIATFVEEFDEYEVGARRVGWSGSGSNTAIQLNIF